MNPATRSPRRFARVDTSRSAVLVAGSFGSLIVLAIAYAVAGRLTTVPGAMTPGDAPALTPTTHTEKIEPTQADHHGGAAATRVQLPAAVGTQGATFTRYISSPRVLRASMWLRAQAGRQYLFAATNQIGSTRAAPRPVTATGNWQRLTLRITPKPGDSVVYLSIIRMRRAGAETFDVDDVRVTPERARAR